MQTFQVVTREVWVTVTTYSVDSDSAEEATEAVQTGTLKYDENEVINRDVEKVISVEISHVN